MQHNANIEIWGRPFNLDLVKQIYDGEKESELQEEAADWFISNTGIMDDIKNIVFDYIKKNSETTISNDENIFKYVVPRAIYIPQNKNCTVAVLCDFRFDIEHGLAIVFEGKIFKEIGPEDIVL